MSQHTLYRCDWAGCEKSGGREAMSGELFLRLGCRCAGIQQGLNNYPQALSAPADVLHFCSEHVDFLRRSVPRLDIKIGLK